MKSDNFELFTTAGERKGRDVLRYFEQVRGFFRQSTPGHIAATLPVRIVALIRKRSTSRTRQERRMPII